MVGRFEYSTYGEIFAVNAQGNLVEFKGFASVIFGFHGRRIDEETGLMYFRNRFYDAQRGRFLSRDAMGHSDSYNLYQSFLQNAISNKDPLGKLILAIEVLDKVQYSFAKEVGTVGLDKYQWYEMWAPERPNADFIKKLKDRMRDILSKVIDTIKQESNYQKRQNNKYLEPLDIVFSGHTGMRGYNMSRQYFRDILGEFHVSGEFKDIRIRSLFYNLCHSARGETTEFYKDAQGRTREYKDWYLEELGVENLLLTLRKTYLNVGIPRADRIMFVYEGGPTNIHNFSGSFGQLLSAHRNADFLHYYLDQNQQTQYQEIQLTPGIPFKSWVTGKYFFYPRWKDQLR